MFDYDKYTPYILTSYGIAAVVIFGLLGWSVMRLSKARRKLNEAEAAEAEARGDAGQ
jgi:heme exporter protein CcmD